MYVTEPLKSQQKIWAESYANAFFEDMLDLFTGINSGHLGKYIYERLVLNKNEILSSVDVWDEIQKKEKSCYISTADTDLVRNAIPFLSMALPKDVPFIDFGPGSLESLKGKTLPLIKGIGTRRYHAVDFCKRFLTQNRQELLKHNMESTTYHEMDFLAPFAKKILKEPAFGVVLGGTFANMYAMPERADPRKLLVSNLKKFSKMVSHGWLLISIDTNQKKSSLIRLYSTPLHELGHRTPFIRMTEELSCTSFNPFFLQNKPVWHPEKFLLAQTVVAMERQDFILGSYNLQVNGGESLHIMNSFKFPRDFFESCCEEAGLDILNVWHHDSPVKLFLLEDKENPHRHSVM